MNVIRYSLIVFLGGLLIVCSGCQKSSDTVVNTSSGIVIRSSDYGIPQDNKIATTTQKQSQNSSKVIVKNNVIHLGGGYQDIELEPVFKY